MDGPVVASLISSSVAVLVAVGSAIRADVQRASDRRYERRRMFLIDAQEAALALREALREYGQALEEVVSGSRPPGAADQQRRAVSVAGGRLAVASSRVEDRGVLRASTAWERSARSSLLRVDDDDSPQEEANFDELNRVISAALRSTRGLAQR